MPRALFHVYSTHGNALIYTYNIVLLFAIYMILCVIAHTESTGQQEEIYKQHSNHTQKILKR